MLGTTHSGRINTMVCDIIGASWAARSCDILDKRPTIRMSPPVQDAAEAMRAFLFERVYNPRSASEETRLAEETVRFLYRYFTETPDALPPEYRRHADTVKRGAVDYIAGMTDQYATDMAEKLKSQA